MRRVRDRGGREESRVTIGHVNCLVCITNQCDGDGDSDTQIILLIGRVDKIECTRCDERARHTDRGTHTHTQTHADRAKQMNRHTHAGYAHIEWERRHRAVQQDKPNYVAWSRDSGRAESVGE